MRIGIGMNSSTPPDCLRIFARVLGLRENEELVQVVSAFQIRVEEVFKDIHLPEIGGLRGTTSIDIYAAIWEGFVQGALAITNQRLVFLRRTRTGREATSPKSPRYEIEETVDLEGLSKVRTKGDLLEIICHPTADSKVLYFTSFYRIGLKQPGHEPMPEMIRVSADEVVDIITTLLP